MQRLPSAVISLSHRMDSNGKISEEAKVRLEKAASEMDRIGADVLVTNGWAYRNDTHIAMADAMKNYAISIGVNARQIIAERRPRDTVGEAVFSKRHLRERPYVMVVTSAFHTQRAKEVFSFVYGPSISVDVVGVCHPNQTDTSASERRSLKAFRGTFIGIDPGDDKAIFQRLCNKHPFYNGDIHPAIEGKP